MSSPGWNVDLPLPFAVVQPHPALSAVRTPQRHAHMNRSMPFASSAIATALLSPSPLRPRFRVVHAERSRLPLRAPLQIVNDLPQTTILPFEPLVLFLESLDESIAPGELTLQPRNPLLQIFRGQHTHPT